MNLIKYLSMQIEIFAEHLNTFLINIFPFLGQYLNNYPETIMIIIGFGGQTLFAARFIIQWLSSENAGRSVIPVAFWYFSILFCMYKYSLNLIGSCQVLLYIL